MAVPDGVDPSLMLDSIDAIQAKGRRARGTIVMDLDDMTSERVRELYDRGVRSVRVHNARLRLYYARETISHDDVARYIADVARRIHASGVRWPIDMQLDMQQWVELVPTMRTLHREYGTAFVADHVFTAKSGCANVPGFENLMALMREGVLIVKISGLTRLGGTQEEVAQLVRRVIANAPEQVIWGSDTPHVIMDITKNEFEKVDVGAQLAMLRDICEGNEGWWEMLMRSNAERLYV
jgi:predicted TIM-barrel fold metal-dependent hydrolase